MEVIYSTGAAGGTLEAGAYFLNTTFNEGQLHNTYDEVQEIHAKTTHSDEIQVYMTRSGV